MINSKIIFIVVMYFFSQKVFSQEILKILPPEEGAYQGAFMDFGATAEEVTKERLVNYQNLTGKKSVWAYFANDWLDGKITFPTQSVDIIRQQNLIPIMRLLPWSEMLDHANSADPIFSMKSFLQGKHDKALHAYFNVAKDYGPIMMEFCPEVNGDWFPWNGRWNGGGVKSNYGHPELPDGPERFKDTYKRIIDIARSEGANNITWIFHVDTGRSPEEEWNQIKYYYPGDEYIDWIGLSVFGAQLPTHEWSNFFLKLKGFVPELESLNTKNPWMISEFGVIESKEGPAKKAQWLKYALQSVEKGMFKKVKGITYWHSPGWLPNDEASFKIDTSPESLAMFQSEIKKEFWLTEPVISHSIKLSSDKK
jgi:hypothetical protein